MEQQTKSPDMRGSGLGAGWDSRPLADRHHVLAFAITLHSLRTALASDNWYLKGSAALSAWIGPATRLPNDLDLVVPAKAAAQRLLVPSMLPPGPRGESLLVARHEPVVFSSGSSPAVYRALVEIRGPEMLPPVLLGLSLAQEEEVLALDQTTWLDFPGPAGAVTVPSITGNRFLTQKLVRYSRLRSGGRVNTHWRDLADMLLAVAHPAFPTLRLAALRQDLVTEMAERGRTPPDCLPTPPAEWLDFWDTATFVDRLAFGRLPEAAGRLARFWEPVLCCRDPAPGREADPMDAVWSPDEWRWNALGGSSTPC